MLWWWWCERRKPTREILRPGKIDLKPWKRLSEGLGALGVVVGGEGDLPMVGSALSMPMGLAMLAMWLWGSGDWPGGLLS